MKTFLIILLCVVGALLLEFLILYVCFMRPYTKRRERMKPYMQRYVAHRGLFDNESDSPENTLAAFRRAIEAGYGIELDVQLTKDGKMVVFHDGSLRRMTGVDRRLADCTYEELLSLPVGRSDERIPLLDDVLALVNGKVPLIIEIKAEDDFYPVTAEIAKRMADYAGEYCVESFHPFALLWYKTNRPDVLRGQLAENFFRDGETKLSFFKKFALTNLLLNAFTKPDFVAYRHQDADGLAFRMNRFLYRAVTAAWTVKNQEELDGAKRAFDVMIFDSFLPEEK